MFNKGKNPQAGKSNPQLVGIILTGVFTVVAALISRLPNIDLEQRKTQEEFKPTATVSVEANLTAAPMVELSPTYSFTPTAPVELTQSQIQAASMDLAGWTLYDDFDNDCVDTSQWGNFIDDRANSMEFIEPANDECWSIVPQGLSEQDGQLEFDVDNRKNNRDYVVYLTTPPGRAFEAIQMELAIEAFSGEMGAVGLFSGPLTDPKQWLIYDLHMGKGLPEGVLDTEYTENNKVKEKGTERYSLGHTVTLTMQWDGQDLNFFANGNPVIPPITFEGNADTFGIYFKLGPKSSMTARINDVRVIWK